MGVRGLQTYVEKQCPAACKTVSLKRSADLHKNIFFCQPQLVVDGMSLANQLYSQSDLEWIYGGQWLQFMKLLNDFIIKFNEIGVELVFFFDGTVCSSKREEWVKRRITKSVGIASLFSDIKKNSKLPDQQKFELPTSAGLLTAFALKELGAKVFFTDREADEDIVKYAHENDEVFGILSQDSDFIIHDTKSYYSLSHFDFYNLETVQYDRLCLANNYLNLNVTQLPLFACLVGNHFVPFDKLKNFHKRILGGGPVYVAALAPILSELIRAQKWTGDPTNEMELKSISKLVFGNYNWINIIRDGLNSYAVQDHVPLPLKMCINIHPDFEKVMYRRHIDCINAPYILNLLCKLEYSSSEVLEDICVEPSALIYRAIRQRCYGVLFNFSNPTHQRNPVIIKEWCAYHGNLLKNPELIKPLPLKNVFKRTVADHVPTIDKIWFTSCEIEKMKIFWAILQLPMEFDCMLKIPKHLLVFSCIINYLIGGSESGPHLKPAEVAIFVAQAVWTKSVTELQQLRVTWIDHKAINLSTLFMRGVTTVLMVRGICDNPFPLNYLMPWHFFDGKLFHYLYTKAQKRLSIYDMCMNQPNTTQGFYNLLASVTNNTMYDIVKFNWRSVLADFDYNNI